MRGRKFLSIVCAGAVAAMAAGCSAPAGNEEVTRHDAQMVEAARAMEAGTDLVVIEDEAVPLYSKPAGSHVRVPSATGSSVFSNGKVTIDYSNASQGYVMVKYNGSNAKIKVQVDKGGVTYTYDLKARDAYEVFPFTEGNGTYSVKVFENISGNQYSQAGSQNVQVGLADPLLPFLYPNQYVNFSANSAVVAVGAQVSASASDQMGVVNNVYNFVVNNISYDTAKANTVTSGYLPNVDTILAQKTGICFDYAAVMTAMLRSQDIPTKLLVGYTGSVYHAWISVYIENTGWVNNVIYFNGQTWNLMDPTFASSGGQSEEIMKYIGNANNYQVKYTY